MEDKEISRKVRAAVSQINKYTQVLEELKQACPHNDVARVAKSDTGNYDPSADKYWYDCRCKVCGRWWTEDQ